MKQIRKREKDYIEKDDKGNYKDWECQLSIEEDMDGSDYSFEFISPKCENCQVYSNRITSYTRQKVHMYCRKQMSITIKKVFYDDKDKVIIEEPYEITIKTILGMSDHASSTMRTIIKNLNNKLKLVKPVKPVNKEMPIKYKILIIIGVIIILGLMSYFCIVDYGK